MYDPIKVLLFIIYYMIISTFPKFSMNFCFEISSLTDTLSLPKQKSIFGLSFSSDCCSSWIPQKQKHHCKLRLK